MSKLRLEVGDEGVCEWTTDREDVAAKERIADDVGGKEQTILPQIRQ